MTTQPSVAEVYQIYAVQLIRYATALVGADAASDVVTDAMLAAHQSPSWAHAKNPRAYFYRSVYNMAMTHLRSNDRRRQQEYAAALRSPTVHHDSSLSVDACKALATLSPQQRAVTYLTYWEDKSVIDIATMLEVSEGTVKKQLARGRDQLRKVMNHG
jgi:RNA polymerase sigma factor (sigma-70 family)